MRIVIVGCNSLGLLIGKILSRGKDNEVQYIDINKYKEPKPKLKVGSGWCKFGMGELYIFTDQRHEYHFVPMLPDVVKFRISEIEFNEYERYT